MNAWTLAVVAVAIGWALFTARVVPWLWRPIRGPRDHLVYIVGARRGGISLWLLGCVGISLDGLGIPNVNRLVLLAMALPVGLPLSILGGYFLGVALSRYGGVE